MDKAKVELISKLLSPTNVKTVRKFLGHAGFYRRFILKLLSNSTSSLKKMQSLNGMQNAKKGSRRLRHI